MSGNYGIWLFGKERSGDLRSVSSWISGDLRGGFVYMNGDLCYTAFRKVVGCYGKTHI